MSYYKDLREHVAALESHGKLVRIKTAINKDTEAMPLVRCQFRGLPEQERKAFLFENVVDVKGKRYGMPLLVASHAASRQVYAVGMQCAADKINEKWQEAQIHPIEPEIIRSGPVHEEVHRGENLLEHGGLEEFPIPISTPGFDNAPYITGGCWVSKDPETKGVNIGTHRAMVKSGTRVGISLIPNQHIRHHWDKCRKAGIPLPVALVIGAAPNIGYVSAAKLPYDVDEYTVAGGIAGEAVKVVKCKTVDIEVPASAEIVIEGQLSTEYMEREAPFGEFSGYMGMEMMAPYLEVSCITHRKNAIFNAFISQFPPSESSKLRQLSHQGIYYKFLKHDCNISGILDVAFHEESGSSGCGVIQMKKTHPTQPWQVLNLAAGHAPNVGKIFIVVDEDIDPRDWDSIVWALCWRVQAHRDIRVTPGKNATMDYSNHPLGDVIRGWQEYQTGHCMLIDATTKWDYPPVSLPRREFMERACKLWEAEGLPPLKLKTPWYGYSLGHWSEENEREAELALKGAHYKTGEKLAKKRVKV